MLQEANRKKRKTPAPHKLVEWVTVFTKNFNRAHNPCSGAHYAQHYPLTEGVADCSTVDMDQDWGGGPHGATLLEISINT